MAHRLASKGREKRAWGDATILHISKTAVDDVMQFRILLLDFMQAALLGRARHLFFGELLEDNL